MPADGAGRGSPCLETVNLVGRPVEVTIPSYDQGTLSIALPEVGIDGVNE
jgi:hypothetical protein